MKYFIDTKVHVYSKQSKLLGVKVSKPIDTIELISIGIVSDNIPIYKDNTKQKHNVKDKEYYAVCKDFDIKAAWNNKLLREGVLKSIWKELNFKERLETNTMPINIGKHVIQAGIYALKSLSNTIDNTLSFEFKDFKRLVNKYGKSRKQIANEIKDFIGLKQGGFNITSKNSCEAAIKEYDLKELKPNDWYPIPEFCTFYTDYTWAVLNQLFVELPFKFLREYIGLKQMLNEKEKDIKKFLDTHISELTVDTVQKNRKWIYDKHINRTKSLKEHPNYPKQANKHNALTDAKWNKQLYKFIKMI